MKAIICAAFFVALSLVRKKKRNLCITIIIIQIIIAIRGDHCHKQFLKQFFNLPSTKMLLAFLLQLK